MTNKILFCNVGWMLEYKGQTPNDKILGGGRYVHVKKNGGEVCNFAQHAGKLYGYVQPTGEQIKLERLGGSKKQESLDDVDVILTARIPGKNGRTVVVGWYRDATVHRYAKLVPNLPSLRQKNKARKFRFETRNSEAKLILPDDRWFEIPRGKDGMGQSNIWYADKAATSWLNEVRDYIESPLKKRKRPPKRKTDPAKNALVEAAAMNFVMQHYESLGFDVEDVSDDDHGWDIDARKGALYFQVEVKGLTAPTGQVGLTPNEYKKYKANIATYRLCIVTSALSSPKLTICECNQASKRLMINPGSPFSGAKLREVIAATVILEK